MEDATEDDLAEEVKDGIINAGINRLMIDLGQEVTKGNKVLRDGKEIEGDVKDLTSQIQKLMSDDQQMVL